MATINGFDLGIVKTERSSKDCNLFFSQMPKQDSDKAYLLDIMGTGRTITITGEFVGEKETIISNVENIEGIADGKQVGGDYNGEIISGKNVYIQTFEWDYVEGDPQRVKYNLTLLEGEGLGA
jgi:hypothetical protein